MARTVQYMFATYNMAHVLPVSSSLCLLSPSFLPLFVPSSLTPPLSFPSPLYPSPPLPFPSPLYPSPPLPIPSPSFSFPLYNSLVVSAELISPLTRPTGVPRTGSARGAPPASFDRPDMIPAINIPTGLIRERSMGGNHSSATTSLQQSCQ